MFAAGREWLKTLILADIQCEICKHFPLHYRARLCGSTCCTMSFTSLKKTLIMASEEFSLALSLNVSCEVVTEDTQWLTSELELAGGRFLKVVNHVSGLFLAAYLT